MKSCVFENLPIFFFHLIKAIYYTSESETKYQIFTAY